MNARNLIDSLERFERPLASFVGDTGEEEARWHPEGGGWSILEIVSHLADEEVEDFRARLRSTLEDPDRAWPRIDPEGWVKERRYEDGDLAAVLARFRSERCASVRWLRGLKDPPWERTHRHPQLGEIRAGDLLAAWAAHDQMHLRQIAKRRYELVLWSAGEYRPDYAGRFV